MHFITAASPLASGQGSSSVSGSRPRIRRFFSLIHWRPPAFMALLAKTRCFFKITFECRHCGSCCSTFSIKMTPEPIQRCENQTVCLPKPEIEFDCSFFGRGLQVKLTFQINTMFLFFFRLPGFCFAAATRSTQGTRSETPQWKYCQSR